MLPIGIHITHYPKNMSSNLMLKQFEAYQVYREHLRHSSYRLAAAYNFVSSLLKPFILIYDVICLHVHFFKSNVNYNILGPTPGCGGVKHEVQRKGVKAGQTVLGRAGRPRLYAGNRARFQRAGGFRGVREAGWDVENIEGRGAWSYLRGHAP